VPRPRGAWEQHKPNGAAPTPARPPRPPLFHENPVPAPPPGVFPTGEKKFRNFPLGTTPTKAFFGPRAQAFGRRNHGFFFFRGSTEEKGPGKKKPPPGSAKQIMWFETKASAPPFPGGPPPPKGAPNPFCPRKFCPGRKKFQALGPGFSQSRKPTIKLVTPKKTQPSGPGNVLRKRSSGRCPNLFPPPPPPGREIGSCLGKKPVPQSPPPGLKKKTAGGHPQAAGGGPFPPREPGGVGGFGNPSKSPVLFPP